MKDVLRLDSPELSKLNIKKADGGEGEVVNVIKDQVNLFFCKRYFFVFKTLV